MYPKPNNIIRGISLIAMASLTIGSIAFTPVNTYAASATSSGIEAQVAPGPALNLVATPGVEQVSLTWSPPNDSNLLPVTDYQVEYKISTFVGWSVFNDAVNTATSTTVISLAPSTNYDFRVAAINSDGVGIYSNVITATPTASPTPINTAPTVSITAPAVGASFVAGQNVTVTATAADSDGTVSNVEFFVNGVSSGIDVVAPYATILPAVVAGNYTLTAAATDNLDLTTTSAGVSFVVTAVPTPSNVAPSVSITTPTAGASFVAGSDVVITATAADSDGTVSSVEFFVNGISVAVDTVAPYTVTISGVVVGTNTITAVATDNQALSTTAAGVGFTVTAAGSTLPPTVSITSPVNAQVFKTDEIIPLVVIANDTNGSITKVEFFDGATSLGEDLTAPYQYDWIDATPGSHSITAKATDNDNATTTSTAVQITVNLAFTGWVSDRNGDTQLPYDMASFNSRLYQTHVGLNKRIYTRSTSNPDVYLAANTNSFTAWAPSVDPLEATNIPVSIAEFNGKIYQTHVGLDRRIYSRSSVDGIIWTNWIKGTDVTEATNYAVYMTAFNNSLYQVHVGVSGNIYTRSTSDGLVYSQWVKGTDILEKTNLPVRLAAFDGKLYQVHVGADQRIYTRSSVNGVVFGPWTRTGDGLEQTSVPVSISAVGNMLYEVHRGSSQQIFTRYSINGTDWTNWQQTDGQTNFAVAMTGFGGFLYQGHVAINGQMFWRRLNTIVNLT